MRYLVYLLLICSFKQVSWGQSQGVTNSQTKLRPNQLRWSPTDATLDSVYIIRADTSTGEPGWYLVTLSGGGGVQDTTLAGDVVGGLNSTFVRKINGVTVENITPQNREVLTYNGTQWTPDSIALEDLPQINASRVLGRGSSSAGEVTQLTPSNGVKISGNYIESDLTAGTGINISGTTTLTVSNSAPDQTVTISGATGTYPNFTVTPTAPGGSTTQVQYNNAGSFGALDSFTVSANPDRVGIGVPTPTARLDIQGSSSATNAIRIGSSTGSDLMLFGNNGKLSLTNGAVTSSSTNDGILGITGFTHTANSGTTNALWGLNIDGTQVFNTANQTSGGLRIKLASNATGAQYSTPLYIETNATTGAINYIKNTTATGGTQIRMTSGVAETDMTLIQSPNSSTSGISEGSGMTIRTSSTHSAFGMRGSALSLMNSSTSGNPQSVNPTLFISDKRVGVGQYAINTPNATLDIKGEGATSATNTLYIRNSGNTNSFTVRDDGLVNILTATEVSKSSLLLSGTGYSGGTATTTKPTLLIEPTGTTSTGWSTTGTKFGVNAESGFSGNLLDLQVNGSSFMSVLGSGTIIRNNASAFRNNTINGSLYFDAGTLVIRDGNSGDTNVKLSFGSLTGTAHPMLKRNGTGVDIRLADDSGYGAVQSLYDRFGSGSPESVVTAPVGAVYHRTDGGAGTSFYVKESGTGNTGWIAK